MKKLLPFLLILLLPVWAWGAEYKIGLVADSHCNATAEYTALGTITTSIFDGESTDAVITLGDMTEGATAAEIAKVATAMGSQTWYFGIGTHDMAGTTLSQFLTDAADYLPATVTERGDWYVDFGNLRVIYLNSNVEGTAPPMSIAAESLTDLGTWIDAWTDSKPIVILTHPWIKKDWPGNKDADSNADVSWTVDPSVQTTEMTVSSATGDSTLTAVSGTPFATAVAGDIIAISQKATTDVVWGIGTVKAGGCASTSECIVTLDTNHPIVDTSNVTGWFWIKLAGAWTGKGYSGYAYNAKEIRALIDTKVTGGSNIVAVISGHRHSSNGPVLRTGNTTTSYYALRSSLTDATVQGAGILQLNDDDSLYLIPAYGETTVSANYHDYFVSASTGADTGKAGRLRSDPWATINKARVTATAADSYVYIMAGTYAEALTVTLAGTDGHPITWEYEAGAQQTHGTSAILSISTGAAYFTLKNANLAATDSNSQFTLIVQNDAHHITVEGLTMTNGASTTGGGPLFSGTGAGNVLRNFTINTKGRALAVTGAPGPSIYYGIAVCSANTQALFFSSNEPTFAPTVYNVVGYSATGSPVIHLNAEPASAQTGPTFKNVVIYTGTGTRALDTNDHANRRSTWSNSIMRGNWEHARASQDLGVSGSRIANGTDGMILGTSETAGYIADAVFTTPGTDFTLLATTVAIDTGADVSLTTDLLGNTVPVGKAQDIGSYERQGPWYFSDTGAAAPAGGGQNSAAPADADYHDASAFPSGGIVYLSGAIADDFNTPSAGVKYFGDGTAVLGGTGKTVTVDQPVTFYNVKVDNAGTLTMTGQTADIWIKRYINSAFAGGGSFLIGN